MVGQNGLFWRVDNFATEEIRRAMCRNFPNFVRKRDKKVMLYLNAVKCWRHFNWDRVYMVQHHAIQHVGISVYSICGCD